MKTFKINIKKLKWLVTVFCLLWNLFLLAADGDIDFIIAILVGANLSAIVVFIALSLYPSGHYVVDKTGICLKNKKGTIKRSVAWERVKSQKFYNSPFYNEYVIEYIDSQGYLAVWRVFITKEQYQETQNLLKGVGD